jgi:uncharacterized protein (TIGR04255 family)
LTLHFDGETAVIELADYAAPPVVEVSLGFQFESLPHYNSVLAAGLWDRLKHQYGQIEEQPPLEPVFETFGSNDGAFPQTRFEFVSGAVQPRYFFINKDSSQLVQLQRDRLHLNWRLSDAASAYPRFPALRANFEEALAAHRDWAADLGDQATPTQVEVVYVNSIPLHDGAGQQCGLSHVFPWLGGLPGLTENGSFQFRRRLFDESDQPVARLHFTLQYGTDEQGDREARMIFMVRGRPQDPSERSCLQMVDDGRKIIVQTFTGMTSDAAHELWEKQT